MSSRIWRMSEAMLWQSGCTLRVLRCCSTACPVREDWSACVWPLGPPESGVSGSASAARVGEGSSPSRRQPPPNLLLPSIYWALPVSELRERDCEDTAHKQGHVRPDQRGQDKTERGQSTDKRDISQERAYQQRGERLIHLDSRRAQERPSGDSDPIDSSRDG